MLSIYIHHRSPKNSMMLSNMMISNICCFFSFSFFVTLKILLGKKDENWHIIKHIIEHNFYCICK